MVAIWASGDTSLSSDGVLTLSDGRTFTLSDVPGNGFNANRLAKINAAAQEILDYRQAITDLPPEDPDRINAEAGDNSWFLSTYGNRVFIDGSDIVTRNTSITIALDDGGEPYATFQTVR
jgi:hypothetical protein